MVISPRSIVAGWHESTSVIPPGSRTSATAVDRRGDSSSEEMTSTKPSMTISIGPRNGPATG